MIASASGSTPLSDPVTAGLMAFARTLANEHGEFPIRRVCIQSGTSVETTADTLRVLLGTPQAETDLAIGPEGCRALRVVPMSDDGRRGERSRRGRAASSAAWREAMAGLSWSPVERSAPAAGEVEIAVEATGLNFRDVMWAMSLLPDDILEDGFGGSDPGAGMRRASRPGGRRRLRLRSGRPRAGLRAIGLLELHVGPGERGAAGPPVAGRPRPLPACRWRS